NPRFQQAQPDLVRFGLNREVRMFPTDVRIFAFYTLSNRMRSSGVSSAIHGLGSGNSRLHVFSEIAFAPFGFVMTLGDTPPPQSDLVDISGFAQYGYRDWRTGISMKLSRHVDQYGLSWRLQDALADPCRLRCKQGVRGITQQWADVIVRARHPP